MSDANQMPARPVNALAEAKAQQAWSMRVAGVPWARIAGVVGYSDDAGAIRAVRNYAGTLPRVERDAAKQLWRERLEWLWARAARDVQEQRPGAIRAAVALAQRASQLEGLDEPTTSMLINPSVQEFDAVVRAMRARALPDLAREADVFAEALEDDDPV